MQKQQEATEEEHVDVAAEYKAQTDQHCGVWIKMNTYVLRIMSSFTNVWGFCDKKYLLIFKTFNNS